MASKSTPSSSLSSPSSLEPPTTSSPLFAEAHASLQILQGQAVLLPTRVQSVRQLLQAVAVLQGKDKAASVMHSLRTLRDAMDEVLGECGRGGYGTASPPSRPPGGANPRSHPQPDYRGCTTVCNSRPGARGRTNFDLFHRLASPRAGQLAVTDGAGPDCASQQGVPALHQSSDVLLAAGGAGQQV